MKASDCLVLAALLAGGVSSQAQEMVLARHLGAADPSGEGFVPFPSGSPSAGPVVDGAGVEAWSLLSPSPADLLRYRRDFTGAAVPLLSQGWTLAMTLRILEPQSDAEGNYVNFRASGFESFLVVFGRQPDGDPIVNLRGVTYGLEGLGGGYHTYRLHHDAETGLASFSVDGAVLADGLSGGANLSNPVLFWGLAQRPPGGAAAANWHEVTLTAVPEPSARALLVLGLCGLLAARRRRQRSVAGLNQLTP